MTSTLPRRDALKEPALSREDFKAHVAQLTEQSDARAAARQHPNGKLTARERLAQLLDPGTSPRRRLRAGLLRPGRNPRPR